MTERCILRHGDLPDYYDWNTASHPDFPLNPSLNKPSLASLLEVAVNAECLRDGLGSCDLFPTEEGVERYLEYADAIGIPFVCVGIYTPKGTIPDEITKHSLKVMRDRYPDMVPIVLARAREEDIDWATDGAFINPKLQVIIFRGSSGPRIWAEGTTNGEVISSLGEHIRMATVKRELPTIAFTEDTTRTPPEFIEEYIKMAVNNGAQGVGIADTVGHADPWGAMRVTKAVRTMLDRNGGEGMLIHWHGHRDRGLDVTNELAAIAGGADVVHGVLIGAGERAGNTRLGVLMYNLNRMCKEAQRMLGLPQIDKWRMDYIYAMALSYAKMTGAVIPPTYPLLGSNAFDTMFGIHADVQWKALCRLLDISEGRITPETTDVELALESIASTVYTTVDPRELGRRHGYRIGPLSGAKSVIMYLWVHPGFDIDPRDTDDPRVSILLEAAKTSGHVLTDEEIAEILTREGYPPRMQVINTT